MRRVLALLTCLAFASACGCITGKSAEPTATAGAQPVKSVSDSALPAAKVKADWQDYMVKALKDAGAEGVEAFGLFSEGGWADAGQIMVVVHKTKAARLLVVPAGRAKVAVDRSLTDAEWKALTPVLADSKGLESIEDTAFDALVFEIAHATKTTDGAAVDRRAYYCNVGGKKAPRHEALIRALQALQNPSF